MASTRSYCPGHTCLIHWMMVKPGTRDLSRIVHIHKHTHKIHTPIARHTFSSCWSTSVTDSPRLTQARAKAVSRLFIFVAVVSLAITV